jgi:hypothetical protein
MPFFMFLYASLRVCELVLGLAFIVGKKCEMHRD